MPGWPGARAPAWRTDPADWCPEAVATAESRQPRPRGDACPSLAMGTATALARSPGRPKRESHRRGSAGRLGAAPGLSRNSGRKRERSTSPSRLLPMSHGGAGTNRHATDPQPCTDPGRRRHPDRSIVPEPGKPLVLPAGNRPIQTDWLRCRSSTGLATRRVLACQAGQRRLNRPSWAGERSRVWTHCGDAGLALPDPAWFVYYFPMCSDGPRPHQPHGSAWSHG